MNTRFTPPRLPALVLLALAFAAALPAGHRVAIIEAQSEVSEARLLDVGIEVLNPGLPGKDEQAKIKRGVHPDIRKSEARFIPCHLKNTLEDTGLWGAVRVLPSGAEAVDVTLTGKIIKSTGLEMVLALKVMDSTGRVWREKRYKEELGPGDYQGEPVEDRDTYQDLYNQIANDMLAFRRKLNDREIREIRQVTDLKFAAFVAPSIYGDYLRRTRKGRYTVKKLPSADDPMMARIGNVRQRDDLFVDTLNEYYTDFYARMDEPYDEWRANSFEEELAFRKIRRQARTRKVLGGLMILSGILLGGEGGDLANVAGDAAMIGGAMAIRSGVQKSQEARIHREVLRELAGSFDAEMAPLLVEVEGRTLRLEGTAETQYSEWRRLMQEIFTTETGLPVDSGTETDLATAGGAGG